MIFFYITEALKHLFRAKLSAFIAVLASSLALIFLSFSLILLFMSNSIETKLKANLHVNILLSKNIEKSQIEKIKNKISNDKRVRSVAYISPALAKQNFIRETGEDFSKLLNNNPLPPSFVVKFFPNKININQVELFVNDYRFSNGIDDVIYDFNILKNLLKMSNPIKLIIFFIAVLLNIFAVYFMFTINKHFIVSKKNQYYTMKLVGAKVISIKMPLLIASVFIGLFSSALVIGLIDTSIILIQKYYYKFSFTNTIYIFNLMVLIFGIFTSLLSSFFASNSISIKLKSN